MVPYGPHNYAEANIIWYVCQKLGSAIPLCVGAMNTSKSFNISKRIEIDHIRHFTIQTDRRGKRLIGYRLTAERTKQQKTNVGLLLSGE